MEKPRRKLLLTLIAISITLLSGCSGPSIVAKTKGKFLEGQADAQYRSEDRLNETAKTLYEQAVDQYNSALSFAPQDGSIYASRGWCKRQLGDKPGALQDLSEAVALAPSNPQCWIQRASLFEDLQILDKALEDYQQAIKLSPKDVSAWIGKAKVETLLGDSKQGIADYTEAIKLAPAALTYCFRATGYRTAGDLKAMREDFAHAARLDPHSWDIYRFRAYSEFIIGDYEHAIDDFELLLKQTEFTDPHTPYAVIQGALSSRLAGRSASENYFLSKGIEELSIPIASKPGAADADVGERWPTPIIQFLDGDITGDTVIKAAGTNNDSLTEAHCYLGFDQLIKKHPDAARKEFQWVKEHGNKTFVEFDAARVRLQSLNQQPDRHIPKRAQNKA